jgi:hypothetical protein
MSSLMLEKYESLVQSNDEYKNINSEILSIEKELREKLTPEQFKIFLKYEQAHAKLEFLSCDIMHSHFA